MCQSLPFSSKHDKEEKIYDISDSQELIYDEYGIRDYPVIENNRFVIKMKSGMGNSAALLISLQTGSTGDPSSDLFSYDF